MATITSLSTEKALLDLFPSGYKFVIYGAGRVCHSIIQYLIFNEVSLDCIYCITVSNIEYGYDTLAGMPIIPIQNVNSDEADILIIATLERYANEILHRIPEDWNKKRIIVLCEKLYYRIRQKIDDYSVDILFENLRLQNIVSKGFAGSNKQLSTISDTIGKKIDNQKNVIGKLFEQRIAFLEDYVYKNRPEYHRKIYNKIKSVMGTTSNRFWREYQNHMTNYLGYHSKFVFRIKVFSHSFYLRKHSKDLEFAYSILIDGCGGRSLRGEYDINLNYDFSVIFDMGANIGLFSVLMANRYPQKRILSYEPEKKNYLLLKKNTVNLKNVDAFCYPIWYRKTYVKVMASRDIHDQERIDSEGAFYVEECAPKEKKSVETVCLSDLLEGYEDFLIKMDIEGAEKEIFERGSLDWIERCKVLIIETHERFYPQDDYSILIHQEMITRGFQCELIGENKVYYKQR